MFMFGVNVEIQFIILEEIGTLCQVWAVDFLHVSGASM